MKVKVQTRKKMIFDDKDKSKWRIKKKYKEKEFFSFFHGYNYTLIYFKNGEISKNDLDFKISVYLRLSYNGHKLQIIENDMFINNALFRSNEIQNLL